MVVEDVKAVGTEDAVGTTGSKGVGVVDAFVLWVELAAGTWGCSTGGVGATSAVVAESVVCFWTGAESAGELPPRSAAGVGAELTAGLDACGPKSALAFDCSTFAICTSPAKTCIWGLVEEVGFGAGAVSVGVGAAGGCGAATGSLKGAGALAGGTGVGALLSEEFVLAGTGDEVLVSTGMATSFAGAGGVLLAFGFKFSCGGVVVFSKTGGVVDAAAGIVLVVVLAETWGFSSTFGVLEELDSKELGGVAEAVTALGVVVANTLKPTELDKVKREEVASPVKSVTNPRSGFSQDIGVEDGATTTDLLGW